MGFLLYIYSADLVLLPRDIFMPAPVVADLRLLFASLANSR